MNQEEWLAERRRLGLPADPAKDFPPAYREDPQAIKSRFAPPGGRQGQSRHAPTTGTTPGGASGARPSTQRTTGATGPQAAAAEQAQLEQQLARLAAAARSVTQRPAQAARQAPVAGGAPTAGATQAPGARPAPPRPGHPAPSGTSFSPTPGPRGAVPAGTRPKKKASPLGTIVGLLVVGGVVFAGPLNSIFDDATSGVSGLPWADSNDDDDPGDWTYSGELDNLEAEDPELADTVTSLTDGLLAGEPTAVKTLVGAKGVNLSTLTPASARLVMGEDASFEVTDSSVFSTTATVTGEYYSGKDYITLNLRFTREDDGAEWVAEQLAFPEIDAGDLPNETTKINGVPVNAAALKKADRPVAVWPGTVSVSLAKSKYTAWQENPVTASATRAVSSGGVASSVFVSPRGERTAAFKKETLAAAQANYERCLRLTDLVLKNCPFSVNASGVSQPRNIRYRQTKDPGTPHLVGSIGSERVVGGNGRVSVSGTGRYAGEPTTLEGNLSVTFNGTVTVRNNKIVYTEGG
jgi:hypothetical protein